jgi:4-amino-4-deoxy-L-arabinose transferase-like glycosyltransferase
VTDLPLAAFLSMAVLWSMPERDENRQPPRVAAAIALGMAVLAKSMPPLVLFLPVLLIDRRNWRRWFLSWPIVAFSAVALPWHIIAIFRNGREFVYVLFIQQQLGRFINDSRQHGQPWWFYGPFFLLFLFPWFPLLPAVSYLKGDKRARVLAAVVVFGLIFFSASINKLPGYILPLVPATCALLGVALARAPRPELWLIGPASLLGALPVATLTLPASLEHLRVTQLPWPSIIVGLVAAAAGFGMIAFWLRSRAFPIAILLAAGGFLWLETELFPALDRTGSARSLWASSHPDCAPARNLRYGLDYYSGKRLPDCAIVDKNANPSGGNGQAQ